MKKYVLIFVLLVSCLQLFSATIYVGANRSVKKIRSALTQAKSGDTIFVDQGHYHEGNIIISKKIHLTGIHHPVIDGDKKYEIFSVKADNVIIEGFKLVHSGISNLDDYAGIKLYDCRGVIVQNNILDDTYFGIYVQYGKNCTIKNNKLAAYYKEEQQSGNGIHCWKSDNLNIVENEVSGHRDGIYFEFVTQSIIKNNITKNNIRYGLHFMFSNNDKYISNVFVGNGAGVSVMFSHGVSMYNNYFKENWGDAAYGLLLKEISDSEILGNHFEKNTVGIFMEGASRIKMNTNVFLNNGWAMKIQASCMDISVIKNNFIGNTFDVGTNGSLVLNTFKNNYWDKYEGYDINKDKIGDIPYRPVSMFSMIVEKNPPAMILFRSFIASLLDRTEKMIPSLTPENLLDNSPLMKRPF
jgi:nitrous oxidase accessory protein